ncbi:hypothetical protein BN946_scf184850.g9 [Trametes cinnabarina]|uniref:BTB domain-containing protein n=1 Tax=Pycnoporus cinnabarinus TaxID=5643 RepID=A0A060SIN4_PYCCI|nr:hypothetical protein BN946_scf184850.g9 [Trametes cinnabarina]
MSSTTPSVPAYRDPSVGDVIIRTSDQVEYHVQQRRLADVSLLFADMFTLPQPPPADGAANQKPIVDVSESSALWDKLLPLIHNDSEPRLNTNDFGDLLEACRKYQAPGLQSRFRIHLLHLAHVDENPFRVYAVACFGGFEDAASAAARRTLRFPNFLADVEEYALVTGRALYRLSDYRRRCGEAAGAVVTVDSDTSCGYSTKAKWLIDANVVSSANPCQCSNTWFYYGEPLERAGFRIRHSWLGYLRDVKDIVATVPSGDAACSTSLLEPVMKAAEPYKCCANKIGMEALVFSGQVRAKIDDAISEVPFVFEP